MIIGGGTDPSAPMQAEKGQKKRFLSTLIRLQSGKKYYHSKCQNSSREHLLLNKTYSPRTVMLLFSFPEVSVETVLLPRMAKTIFCFRAQREARLINVEVPSWLVECVFKIWAFVHEIILTSREPLLNRTFCDSLPSPRECFRCPWYNVGVTLLE